MGLFSAIGKLMGGALGGPIISAGASLLGGVLNNKQRNKELGMSDPAYIRERAEAAGFNPLLFTNQAFQNSSNVPTFGSAVADAGHFLGEGLLRNQEMKGEQALRITELQQQNERLTELMRRTTLNPRSRSIYGANNVDANSGSNNSADPVGSGIGSTASIVAPDRDVVVTPYSSGSGFTEIDNVITRNTGGPVVVPGSDGEPMDADELATLVLIGVPQQIGRFGASTFDDWFLNGRRYRYQRSRSQNRQNVGAARSSGGAELFEYPLPTFVN